LLKNGYFLENPGRTQGHLIFHVPECQFVQTYNIAIGDQEQKLIVHLPDHLDPQINDIGLFSL